MNAPTPPPPPQTAIPVQNVLSYAGNQVFERAVFRLIGWISIVTALVLISSLFLDMLLLPQTKLPVWWLALNGDLSGRASGFYYFLGGSETYLFLFGVVPIAAKLLALPLLAGGIGCLRRYARTRAWMLLYAIPQLILSTSVLTVELHQQWSSRVFRSSDPQSSVSDLLLELASSIPLLAWPILIIYLMTRPYVARLYEKQTY